MNNSKKYIHVCEVCGRRESLTPEEAYEEGWDYPPKMGAFGILSPRTCPFCSIDKTSWWAIAVEHKSKEELTDEQLETIRRVKNEPDSIIP